MPQVSVVPCRVKGCKEPQETTEGPASALRESCQVLVPVILRCSQMFCLQTDHFARSVCNMGFWGIANHVEFSNLLVMLKL